MTPNEALNPLRSLKATFETMALQPALLWGGALLLVFIDQIAGIGFQFAEPAGKAGGRELLVIVIAGACVVGLGAFLLSTWLVSGLFLNFRSVARRGEPTEGGLFDHEGKFIPLLLTRVLVVIGSLILVLPGTALIALLAFAGGDALDSGSPLAIAGFILAVIVIYVLILLLVIGLAFAESAVIYEDLRPTEALKRSWSLASGRRWRFLLFFFVNGLFAFLGVLLCCVGVFATSAITRLATAEAFLQLTAAPRVSSEDSQLAQLD